jgi:hypothetical protein
MTWCEQQKWWHTRFTAAEVQTRFDEAICAGNVSTQRMYGKRGRATLYFLWLIFLERTMSALTQENLSSVAGGEIGNPDPKQLSAGSVNNDTSCKGDGWYTQFEYGPAKCVQYDGFNGSSATACSAGGSAVGMGYMGYENAGGRYAAMCITDGTTTICGDTETQGAYDSWR